jgi:hypothetical protein
MKNDLKTNWKVYLFFIVALIAIGAIGIAGYYYNKSNLPGQVKKAQQVLQHPQQPVTNAYKDKSGNQHVQISASDHSIPQAVLKDSSVKRDSIIKKVTNDLNLTDPGKLLEVTQENLQLRAAVLKLRQDSANLAMLVFHDNALSFYYNPADSTVRDFSLDLHLNQVKMNKRKWLTNTPVYDFYADDPRVTFSGFNHFVVAVPPPAFGLVADAKTTYDFRSKNFYPSVGLDIRVGKFNLEGREYGFIKDDRFDHSHLLSLSYKQTIY